MKKAPSKEKPAPGKLETGCGSAILIVLVLAAYKGCTALSTTPAPTPSAPAKAMSKADTLKAMTAKISDIALEPLDQKYDPEGYAKLGKRVWGVSNDLRRWAGIAALQSDNCKAVSAIAVSEKATRSQLSWNVVCGDERFIISEEQARGARVTFDPDVTDADRKRYASGVAPAQPMSAAFANFSAASAVVACDNVMKEASVDRGSFDASWSWDEARDEEAGHAIITREYSAKNAMGGKLSGKYRCVVDAATGHILGLKASDAFGVHDIVSGAGG